MISYVCEEGKRSFDELRAERVLPFRRADLFFDECAFSMQDFSRKVWTHTKHVEELEIYHPTLTLKLLAVVSRDRLIAFSLSEDHLSSNKVLDFLAAFLQHERGKWPKKAWPYVILDNASKNRSPRLKKLACKSAITLAYIASQRRSTTLSKIFSRSRKILRSSLMQ